MKGVWGGAAGPPVLQDAMTVTGMSVVVVDDDAEIRDLIREYLSEEGFVVREADGGPTMWELVRESAPDLVLLDLKLPGDDGLTLARDLRQQFPAVGIVMISAKEDVVDRVAGLEIGADDYLVKPFHLRELLARVRSVLRRQEGSPGAMSDETPPRKLYRFSDWELDADGRSLLSPDRRRIELTSGEFDLLLAFAARPRRALTRDQLLDFARNREAGSFDRSIDVQVGRLRRKIEPNPRRPVLIKTVRNVGYMFDVDVTAADT